MLRFTIRDVMWLTVVVALASAWGVDRYRLRRDVRVAAEDTTYAFTIVSRYGNHHRLVRDALAQRGLKVEERQNGELVIVDQNESKLPEAELPARGIN